jgi:hypothetical protein
MIGEENLHMLLTSRLHVLRTASCFVLLPVFASFPRFCTSSRFFAVFPLFCNFLLFTLLLGVHFSPRCALLLGLHFFPGLHCFLSSHPSHSFRSSHLSHLERHARPLWARTQVGLTAIVDRGPRQFTLDQNILIFYLSHLSD